MFLYDNIHKYFLFDVIITDWIDLQIIQEKGSLLFIYISVALEIFMKLNGLAILALEYLAVIAVVFEYIIVQIENNLADKLLCINNMIISTTEIETKFLIFRFRYIKYLFINFLQECSP